MSAVIFGARPIFNNRGVELEPQFFKFLHSFKAVLHPVVFVDAYQQLSLEHPFSGTPSIANGEPEYRLAFWAYGARRFVGGLML